MCKASMWRHGPTSQPMGSHRRTKYDRKTGSVPASRSRWCSNHCPVSAPIKTTHTALSATRTHGRRQRARRRACRTNSGVRATPSTWSIFSPGLTSGAASTGASEGTDLRWTHGEGGAAAPQRRSGGTKASADADTCTRSVSCVSLGPNGSRDGVVSNRSPQCPQRAHPSAACACSSGIRKRVWQLGHWVENSIGALSRSAGARTGMASCQARRAVIKIQPSCSSLTSRASQGA